MFSRRFTLTVFALVVVLFGWGVFELLVMRFDTGEMFPPYSSYRNDPIGTKALFATLDRIPGVNAARYVDPLDKRSNAPANQTVLMIGVNTQQPDSIPASIAEELDAVAEKGGRVVLAFAPRPIDFREDELQGTGFPGLGPSKDSDDQEDNENDRSVALAEPIVSIKEHWGIALEYESLRFDGDGGVILQDATLASSDDLPETIEWHNGLLFDLDDNIWRTVYECRNEVVVAERMLGNGSLVFVGDSYYLTNEGLAENRQTALIAWLIGGNPYVQFDEQHLGMQRNPGAAALMRRYGLQSLIGGFIFLAILFAWRAGSSLAPRYSDTLPTHAGEMELGRDAHAGFTNLVKRSTPRDEVVGECVIQWRHSVLPGLGRADAKDISEALTQIVNAHKTAAPVETYRAVLNQLRERNVHSAYDRKS